MFSEGNLAEIYYSLKIKDSAYKYARKSFEGLPKNAIHYAMLSKLYANEDKIDSIIFQYHEINTPPKQGINTIYLASMNNFFNQLPDSLSKTGEGFPQVFLPSFHTTCSFVQVSPLS